jgi:hypothetical protein
MLAGALREANRKIEKKGRQKGLKYEYRANVNHAAGVLKGRLIGILIAGDPFVRRCLFECLVPGIKRRTGAVGPESAEEEIPEKAAFPSQPQIELLRGTGRERTPLSLLLCLVDSGKSPPS